MIDTTASLKPGLYVVSTPIGNLEDITLRALRILKDCDIILCEDTRVSHKLLQAYGINKKLMSYHNHNADDVRPKIICELKEGRVISLISDAGTPLISDPGYKLVRECRANGIYVTSAPGASSVLSALVLSGQPSDQFLFAGFVDSKKFKDLEASPATLIFFESARRLLKTLEKMADIYRNRTVSVVREITKIYEETRQGSIEELITNYKENGLPKGEVVIVLSPPLKSNELSETEINQLLIKALAHQSVRDASASVAESYNLPKKLIYQQALNLKNANQEV
jgi:16S rRNA (cytidine1402-2'-O)-methyltransferase